MPISHQTHGSAETWGCQGGGGVKRLLNEIKKDNFHLSNIGRCKALKFKDKAAQRNDTKAFGVLLYADFCGSDQTVSMNQDGLLQQFQS